MYTEFTRASAFCRPHSALCRSQRKVRRLSEKERCLRPHSAQHPPPARYAPDEYESPACAWPPERIEVSSPTTSADGEQCGVLVDSTKVFALPIPKFVQKTISNTSDTSASTESEAERSFVQPHIWRQRREDRIDKNLRRLLESSMVAAMEKQSKQESFERNISFESGEATKTIRFRASSTDEVGSSSTDLAQDMDNEIHFPIEINEAHHPSGGEGRSSRPARSNSGPPRQKLVEKRRHIIHQSRTNNSLTDADDGIPFDATPSMAFARANARRLRKPALGSVLDWEHQRCKERKISNKVLETKLRAFDLRYLVRPQQVATYTDEFQHREDVFIGQVVEDDSVNNRKSKREDVEVGFHIVSCSSQKKSHEAKRLGEQRGKWESNTRSDQVQNEYLVFGLHGLPCTITGIELTMGGTSANPKRCRIQYCAASQNGPWLDAWSFVVEPAGALSFRSRHQYGDLTKQFKDMVFSFCGDLEGACYIFDTNGNGMLSKSDFEAAFLRFQEQCGGASTQMEPHKIFRECDVDGLGEISLDDLLGEVGPRHPVAAWWRLVIVDNWGSPNSVMLFSPLRLFSTEIENEYTSTPRRSSIVSPITLFCEEMLVAHAEHFHTSPEMRMIRRLANQYNLPVEEVEQLFKQYTIRERNAFNAIERKEFDFLVTTLYGLCDKGELPSSRLDYFWRQADEDRNGSIDFEEFVVWYFRKSPLKLRTIPES